MVIYHNINFWFVYKKGDVVGYENVKNDYDVNNCSVVSTDNETNKILQYIDVTHREVVERLIILEEEVVSLREDFRILREDFVEMREEFGSMKQNIEGMKQEFRGMKQEIRVFRKDFSDMKKSSDKRFIDLMQVLASVAKDIAELKNNNDKNE